MTDFLIAGVVGGGAMGSGIAYEIARSTACSVIVRDVDDAALAKARASINKMIDRQRDKGQISAEAAEEQRARIRYSSDWEVFAEADIVIEAAFEDMAVKRGIFAKLDAVCRPTAILASNTSGLSITEIASVCARPERVIGLHFFNPVPAMKLVEVITAYQTDAATLQKSLEFCQALGKETAKAKDYPGFITTRIGMAMLAEAARCLDEGVGTVEDIDVAIRLGYNFPMGPFELADLVGIDVLLHILENNTVLLGERFIPTPLLRQMTAAGKLGRKTGEGFYRYENGKKLAK